MRSILGYFLIYDFWTPPHPINFVYMDLISITSIILVMWPQRPFPNPVLAAVLGPLACPSSANLKCSKC